ncbi:MAG: prepilin-type N-terminal cleavage/methylation domain-containing protein [Betaproteobacteria bacterium]|nr:MAG: prepilin-type N-terminal cleavage/methylation domain-containing protein [Betaproteobacteria bacterium]TMI07056.1 MAG: prepilin-type N-terminal cleavage/methylation domain-containing protein [Betaproteobacteria bacterium]
MPCPERSRERGVTLIEMVIVIAITAIIAGAVSVFISRPVEGYADAARRAEMSDIADTALRRMTRDLRTALANSIRITCVPSGCAAGSVYYLEYLQSSGGGRYRTEKDSGGAGLPLDFTAPAASFDVIGTMPTFAGGESIVIYNLAASGTTANAYVGDNRGAYLSNTPSTITLSPAKQFPFSSPGKRFNVVQYAVTYACNQTTGQLRRYWGYGIVDPQPTPPAGGSNALLASNVAACSFTYANTGAAQRTGVVMLSLQIQESGSTDSIQLFQQVHVTNVP